MLTSDFKEFAALLNSNGVEYLVVGGYALAAYGHPRYTGDLDFWIGTDAGDADSAGCSCILTFDPAAVRGAGMTLLA